MISQTSRLLTGFSVAAVAVAGSGVYLGIGPLGTGLVLSILFLFAKRLSARNDLQRAALGWQALLVAALVYGVSEFYPVGLLWGGLFLLFGVLLLATEPAFYRTSTPY